MCKEFRSIIEPPIPCQHGSGSQPKRLTLPVRFLGGVKRAIEKQEIFLANRSFVIRTISCEYRADLVEILAIQRLPV
jgi:hypothetical protein